MGTRNPCDARNLAKRIERLKSSIAQLTNGLYGLDERDQWLKHQNLKTYRTEVMRGFILYLHLANEDLLRALLFDFLVKHNRSLAGKIAKRSVEDLRSADLINWCGRLKLIRPKEYAHILELNRVRNACAHNWVLDLPRTRSTINKGVRRRIRIPRVTYNGKNLFANSVFADEFLAVYSKIYLKLLFRVWKTQGKI